MLFLYGFPKEMRLLDSVIKWWLPLPDHPHPSFPSWLTTSEVVGFQSAVDKGGRNLHYIKILLFPTKKAAGKSREAYVTTSTIKNTAVQIWQSPVLSDLSAVL